MRLHLLLLLGILSLGYISAHAQCTFGVLQEVSGGGTLACATGATVNVVLESPEVDVYYFLYKDGVEVPSSQQQDNHHINIVWPVSVTGTYTVKAYRDGCSSTTRYLMDNSVSVSPPPSGTNISVSSSDPSNNVCEDTNYTLTASGGSGYTWYANVSMDYPTNQSTIEPEQSGTYYVTGVNNCGTLKQSNPIVVTIRNNVLPPSAPSVATGYAQMSCKGTHADTQYSTSALASINAASYTWAIDGGHSVSSSGLVTWNSNFSGTATLTVSAHGCGTTQSTSRSIVVRTLASATLSVETSTNLCLGETVAITLTGDPLLDPDATYTFLRDGTTNAGQFFGHDQNDQPRGSYALNKSEPGVYTAVASNDGCTNIPMSGSVTVTRKNPTSLIVTPSIPLSNLCGGDPLTLTATGSSNTVWIMKPPLGSNEEEVQVHTPGAPTTEYDPKENGVYYARGTDLNCNTLIQSTDQTIIFWARPVIYFAPSDSTTICTTCSVVISTPLVSSFDYVWRKDGVVIEGNTSNSYITNQPGSYIVDVTSHNCTTIGAVVVRLNQLPIADAGPDMIVYLPPNRIISRPAGYFDPDGHVTAFQWTKISGPSVRLIGAQTSTVSITDFGLGTYIFRLTITDDLGDVDSDDFEMLVLPLVDNHNYVQEDILTVAGKLSAGDVESATVDEKMVKASYVDGLGRGLQMVQWKASPQRYDIVQPMTYDQFGREDTKYLPYTGGVSGQLKEDFLRREDSLYRSISSPQYQLYQTGGLMAQDTVPYVRTVYESSALNRIVKQGAPGAAWQPDTDHVIKKEYLINADSAVFLFNFDATNGQVSLASSAYYDRNALLCNRTIDEEGNDMVEYIDKQGRTVCKKVKASNSTYASTYYLYDDFGNLVVVLPPEAVLRLTPQN